MSNLYHIQITLAQICKNPHRDNPTIFQRYLCVLIFPYWSDFCKYYNEFCKEKHDNIESFLSALFEIDSTKVKSISQQLDIYKNYKITEKQSMQDCCNIKLCL